MYRLIQLLLVFFLATVMSWGIKPAPKKVPEITKQAIATESAQVSKVIDGDTIELSTGQKVRYIGINAPEWNQCFGKEATEENRKRVNGKIVTLGKDISETDKYGRLLRYVYVDNMFVNDSLIREGFARIETVPPDVKFSEKLQQAEHEARENSRGLWSSCSSQ